MRTTIYKRITFTENSRRLSQAGCARVNYHRWRLRPLVGPIPMVTHSASGTSKLLTAVVAKHSTLPFLGVELRSLGFLGRHCLSLVCRDLAALAQPGNAGSSILYLWRRTAYAQWYSSLLTHGWPHPITGLDVYKACSSRVKSTHSHSVPYSSPTNTNLTLPVMYPNSLHGTNTTQTDCLLIDGMCTRVFSLLSFKC